MTLNFLKEHKPRSCVMLRLHAGDGIFSGKHWNVILYQFVLDFTAVNAGVVHVVLQHSI